MRHRVCYIACSVLTVLAIAGALQAAEPEASSTNQNDARLARRDAIIVRALVRMPDVDVKSDSRLNETLMRHLDRKKGTREFIQLVKRYQPAGIETKLIGSLLGNDASTAVAAAEMMLELDAGRPMVQEALRGDQAVQVTETLGLLGNGRANWILSQIASNEKIEFTQRRAAVAGLARTRDGQQRLIGLAREKTLVGDTILVAASVLSRSQSNGIRLLAAEVLPMPSMKDAKPMPPVDELAKLSGDAANGMKLFRSTGTCANCHIVSDFGKDVGPNLTEIGSKLSREAMLTAILAPSAGISHNYENYSALTIDGQVITGLKVSETDSQVVIRTADAIDRTLSKDDIEQLKKNEKSIMPENLHHITGQDGLIDVVEYMMTLKKKS